MLKIHLLGHVYVTDDHKPVHVSSKAAALLTYLALEKQAHHREHLSELLWDHPDALRNLRVELARLKQLGINPFPARQPMLSLSCETDLESCVHQAASMGVREFHDWLAQLRGTPLSGLEDLGSSCFRTWVDHQRDRITERLEGVMAGLLQRFAQQGQAQVENLILARAEELGLSLPEVRTAYEPDLTPVNFTYSAQEWEVRRLLGRAAHLPQLLLLSAQSGSKHALLDGAIMGTSWRAVHIQASAHRRLVQAALLQQLSQLLREVDLGPGRPVFHTTNDDDADLIRATQYLSSANVPLVLAFHDMTTAEPWLANGIRYALDLRIPLLIVLGSPSERALREMRQLLGHLDWSRQHDLSLAPMGAQGVCRALNHGPFLNLQSANAAHQQAATLAQQSDGWPLHIRHLLQAPPPTTGIPRQPEVITQAVLAELTPTPAPILVGLQRLALVVDRVDPAVAQAVLGDEATEILRCAQQQGILVPASLNEDVHLPSLSHFTSDAETHLCFASEHLRVALASRLTSAERHDLRCLLAHYYLNINPNLSVAYAERAHLHELAQQTKAALPEWPLQSFNVPEPRPCAAPPTHAETRREKRTFNGYRVALENGHLELMRKGRPGCAPYLTLHFRDVPAGPWSIVARLDVFETHTLSPSNYALGISLEGRPCLIYSTQAIAAQQQPPPENAALRCGLGKMPLGQWVRLSGESQGGSLSLSSRATNFALTIAAMTWNGQPLIPAPEPAA